MAIVDTISKLFTAQGFVGLIQFLVVILMIVWILFAFMLTRLVKIMNESFSSPVAPLFSFLTTVHFIASVLVVILAILIL